MERRRSLNSRPRAVCFLPAIVLSPWPHRRPDWLLRRHGRTAPVIAPELPQAAVEVQFAGSGAFDHRGEIPSCAARKMLLGLRRDDGEDHDGHLTADDAAGLAPKGLRDAHFVP